MAAGRGRGPLAARTPRGPRLPRAAQSQGPQTGLRPRLLASPPSTLGTGQSFVLGAVLVPTPPRVTELSPHTSISPPAQKHLSVEARRAPRRGEGAAVGRGCDRGSRTCLWVPGCPGQRLCSPPPGHLPAWMCIPIARSSEVFEGAGACPGGWSVRPVEPISRLAGTGALSEHPLLTAPGGPLGGHSGWAAGDPLCGRPGRSCGSLWLGLLGSSYAPGDRMLVMSWGRGGL